MRLSQKKGYYALEQQLKKRYLHLRENELVLSSEDFSEGRLKDSGFIRLKNECWYIPYSDPVVIRTPEVSLQALEEDLGFFAVRALSKLKNDRRSAFWQSVALFMVGVVVLSGLSFFWDNVYEYVFLLEFITIISWVFIWSGVSKWFIEHRDLQDKRFTILQLLSAQILPIEEAKSLDIGEKYEAN